jgi:hypothetical protein
VAVAATVPACADGIVQITNASASAVTVRIDGNFGCRAMSKKTAPGDMDVSDHCSFGATTGNHVLQFDYDVGKSPTRSVSVPSTGLVLTLTGGE